VRDDARKRLGELVVDEVGDRERQVQEIAERPDPALRERHPPPRGALDEGEQAAVGGDLTRVPPPDQERRGEECGPREHGQAHRRDRRPAHGVRQVEGREGERAADAAQGEAGEERGR
jgi:hypothetical protein